LIDSIIKFIHPVSSPTFDDFDDDDVDDDDDSAAVDVGTGGDKRAVLSKQATHVLKAWLYQHLMVRQLLEYT